MKLPPRWIDDRVCQTSVRNLTERIPPHLGLAVAGWTGLVPTRRASRTYLNLYFSLERTEDLELLTWLYALPVSRRGAGIKRVLRAGLAAFLHEQYPDRSPLSHAAVRDVVATRARARRGRRAGERANDGGRTIPPPLPAAIDPSTPPRVTDPALETPAPEAVRSSDDVEARLDHLLRSFVR